MSKLIELRGKRFGKFTVLHRVKDRLSGKTKHREVWYLVQCDCGRKVSTRSYMLRSGRITGCKICRPKGRRHGLYGTTEYRLWNSAKTNAERSGLRFNLRIKDIKIPKICPLLEIHLDCSWPLTVFNSPSVDRINPGRGYTRDNIWIISQRANRLKNNASIQEMKLLAKNMERYHGFLVR